MKVGMPSPRACLKPTAAIGWIGAQHRPKTSRLQPSEASVHHPFSPAAANHTTIYTAAAFNKTFLTMDRALDRSLDDILSDRKQVRR